MLALRVLSIPLSADRSAALLAVALLHIGAAVAFYSGLMSHTLMKPTGPLKISPVAPRPAVPPPRIEVHPARLASDTLEIPQPSVPFAASDDSQAPVVVAAATGSGAATPAIPVPAVTTRARPDPRHPFKVGRDNYPDAAIRAGQEGRCVVDFSVDPEGRIGAPRLTVGTGFALLDAACLSAVRGQRMIPATSDGRPVASQVSLPISWKIAHD